MSFTTYRDIDTWLEACKDAGLRIFAHEPTTEDDRFFSCHAEYPGDRRQEVQAVFCSYPGTDPDFGFTV